MLIIFSRNCVTKVHYNLYWRRGHAQSNTLLYLHFILILHFTQIQHFLRHLFLPSQLPARQNKYFSLGGGGSGEAAWNICENLFPAPKAEQTCFVLHHTTWVLPAKQLIWVPAKEMVTSTLNIMLENCSFSGEFLGCYYLVKLQIVLVKFGSRINIFQCSMRGLQKQWWQCGYCGLVFLVLTFFWSFKLFLSLPSASAASRPHAPSRHPEPSRANIVRILCSQVLTNICFSVASVQLKICSAALDIYWCFLFALDICSSSLFCIWRVSHVTCLGSLTQALLIQGAVMTRGYGQTRKEPHQNEP